LQDGLTFLAPDSAAITSEQQWFAAKPDVENFVLSLRSDSEAFDGRVGKARELTKRATDSGIRADNKEAGAIWWGKAALREAAFGNSTEARQAAAAGLKPDPESPAVELEAALTYAMAGDSPKRRGTGERPEQAPSVRYPDAVDLAAGHQGATVAESQEPGRGSQPSASGVAPN
jgi:hypothetical protein